MQTSVSTNVSYEKATPGQLLCNAVIYLGMIAFFGFYAFGSPDDGRQCFIQQVWSPAINDYAMKATSYSVDSMDNTEISGRFHIIFTFGFYGMASMLVLTPLLTWCAIKNLHSFQNEHSAKRCLFILMVAVVNMIFLAWYITALVFRFNSEGQQCSENLLKSQGTALKAYFVLTLLIPCCPCAVAILFCC